MTEKQKFLNYLKSQRYNNSSVLHRLSLVPMAKLTTEKHKALLSSINVCLFDGINTKDGDLGCITFYFGGVLREYRRKFSTNAEMLKKAFCPDTASEAITAFESWRSQSWDTIKGWKTLI